MDFWLAIVIIVVVGSITGVIKHKYEHGQQSTDADETINELTRRLDAHEERIRNLESIIVTMEKERKFDSL